MQSWLEAVQPDVIHLASGAYTLGTQTVDAARALGIPCVAVYQTDMRHYANSWGGPLAKKVAKEFVRYIHTGATQNQAPSRAAREDLVNHGVSSDTVRLWGRGVDTVLFNPQRRESSRVQALRQRISPEGKLIVGYVGRLAPEKNVEALASLIGNKAIQLAIVGDGPSRVKLQNLFRDGAVFMGERRGNDLADSYAAMDTFVHPGPNETFCQTIQEAMATGLAVVAPAAGGPLDIVREGDTGLFFDPTDTTTLHSSIAWLINNPEVRVSMGEKGRSLAENRTWKKLVKELIGHYRHSIELMDA